VNASETPAPKPSTIVPSSSGVKSRISSELATSPTFLPQVDMEPLLSDPGKTCSQVASMYVRAVGTDFDRQVDRIMVGVSSDSVSTYFQHFGAVAS